jgi:hypothetical protein
MNVLLTGFGKVELEIWFVKVLIITCLLQNSNISANDTGTLCRKKISVVTMEQAKLKTKKKI